MLSCALDAGLNEARPKEVSFRNAAGAARRKPQDPDILPAGVPLVLMTTA
jgi:hypothetical protein